MKAISTSTLCLICFFCVSAHADSIYAGSWSKHFKQATKTELVADPSCTDSPCQTTTTATSQIDLNESNNLIAYEHKHYVIGHMINSFNQSTIFAFKQFSVTTLGDFHLYADLGATYGYRDCHMSNNGDNAKLCPAAGVELIYEKHPIQPVILVTNKAASFSLKFSF